MPGVGGAKIQNNRFSRPTPHTNWSLQAEPMFAEYRRVVHRVE